MARIQKAAAKKKTSAKSKSTKPKAIVKAVKKVASPTQKSTKKPVAKKKAPIVKPAKKTAKKSRPVRKKTKRKPETLMCFLTTACVQYYGLPDNGYELNTLRHYRDTYLASSTSGKKLIKNYYAISPQIVSKIEGDKNKKPVYAYIYSQVKSSCEAIELKKFERARKLYTRMVKTLQEKYLLH